MLQGSFVQAGRSVLRDDLGFVPTAHRAEPSARAADLDAAEGNAVAGTAATVWVTFPEDLCIQVGAR